MAMQSKAVCRLVALLLMLSFATTVWADSLRITEAVQGVRELFVATERMSIDLERAPLSQEWPDILRAAPATKGTWHGPYVHFLKPDPWGSPYLLRPEIAGPGTFGVYSIGANGIDERGLGDDVSSWAGFDPHFYQRHQPNDLMILMGLPLLLACVLGYYVYRRIAYHAGRS